MLGLSKYGGVGRETKRESMIKNFMRGVISMTLSVLMLKKDQTMHQSKFSSNMHLYFRSQSEIVQMWLKKTVIQRAFPLFL